MIGYCPIGLDWTNDGWIKWFDGWMCGLDEWMHGLDGWIGCTDWMDECMDYSIVLKVVYWMIGNGYIILGWMDVWIEWMDV